MPHLTRHIYIYMMQGLRVTSLPSQWSRLLKKGWCNPGPPCVWYGRSVGMGEAGEGRCSSPHPPVDGTVGMVSRLAKFKLKVKKWGGGASPPALWMVWSVVGHFLSFLHVKMKNMRLIGCIAPPLWMVWSVVGHVWPFSD